mmetsp:Transcript_26508/g.74517  ORF Transcript_26508/g.74517 Transcript_26508/m.74517 type:complete len:728 (+) Transcript_26508:274-2457(+)
MADIKSRPLVKSSASEAGDRAKAALDLWAIFGPAGKPDENPNEDGNTKSETPNSSKWTTKRVLAAVGLFLSAVVIAAGVALNVLPENPDMVSFRWFFFAGAILPVFVLCRLLCRGVFRTVELHFFRELLAHYENLVRAVARTMAVGILAIWHTLLFSVLWCTGDYESVCTNGAYLKSVEITSKVLACVLVATMARLIAASIAKAMSTHFYKSTHFKKLKAALEKEFQLRALSKPRKARAKPKPKPCALAPSSAPASMRGTDNSRRVSVSDPAIHQACAEESAAPYDGVAIDMAGAWPRGAGGRSVGNSPQRPRRSSSGDESESESVLGELEDSVNWSELGDVQFSLDKDMVNDLPIELLENQDLEDIDEMSEADIERIRTAVVIKTYSALTRQHKFRTAEDAAEQLKAVRKFGSALFQNVRGPESKRDYVTLQDFRLFYTDDKAGKTLASKAFQIFSSDPSAKITKTEVIHNVEAVFVSRSDVAASLHDTDSMMDSLENGIAGGLHFLFIAVYFAIWGIEGFTSLVTAIVALSFIFGNSIRNTFEAMLFLFIQHPYDVGDWTNIDGEWLKVKKIGLLHTSFQNFYDHTVTFQNSPLFGKRIDNLSRFPQHSQYITVEVDIGYSKAVKDEIFQKLSAVVKGHKTEYNYCDVKVSGLTQKGLKASILVVLQYNMPADDWARKREAAELAVTAITDIITKHQAHGAVAYSYHSKVEITDSRHIGILPGII